jgi:hypothetical protein
MEDCIILKWAPYVVAPTEIQKYQLTAKKKLAAEATSLFTHER